jgi:drug/metabolite transporter (DMT)-like permease
MRGYLEVGLASLANGSIGVMVSYADMPATMLLCLRMVFAAAVLGLVVLATGSWRDLRTPGAPLRVLGISVALSLNLILYFLAIRYTGVAVAIFLSYLAPVYLAFVAPRILKERTEPVVYLALVIGLAGMALILVPGLLLEGVQLSTSGLLCAWGAGVMYAVYLLFAKSLRGLGGQPHGGDHARVRVVGVDAPEEVSPPTSGTRWQDPPSTLTTDDKPCRFLT